MAVESLECCLSRAIGSSCTGETQTYSSEEPGSPLRPAGWTVQGCLVSCGCSVASPNQHSHPHWPESQDTPRGSVLQPLRLLEGLLTPP